MLLAIDVGNTNTVLGVFDGDEVVEHWRIATDPVRTADEIAVVLSGLLAQSAMLKDPDISGIALCSTVPSVLHEMREMFRRYYGGVPALIVEPGVRTGVSVRMDNPKEVGSDRIMNAVAAVHLYGGPALVVDFGTSTNFDAVSARGEFVGGALAPGIEISVDALSRRAAQLLKVELARPNHVIGKNTVEALQSGIIFGFAGQVDGIARRMVAELAPDDPDSVTVIATGGLAPLVLDEITVIDAHEPWLTLIGLRLVFERNTQSSQRPPETRQHRGVTPGSLVGVEEDQRQAEVPEQMRVRLAKRERLLAEGTDPYPVGFPRTDTIKAVRERYPDLVADTATGERVGVVGRVMLSRIGGKLCFATIRDGTGDIQVMISADRVGEDRLADWKRDVDLGDHIGVEGEVISSRRGELSVLADSFAITAKALRPLPEKHHGLTDPEARVRQRYVDLIVNPRARRIAEIRAAVTRAIREELHDRGFLEVETPVLQVIHGGANARPFRTHINAYNMDLYLRIALELYLKRLVVGGIEKVYEIGRNFRNEGVDGTHNPEFTMLEVYEAYGDYTTMATLTRELIQRTAREALGGTQVHRVDGTEADIGGEWPFKTVYGAVSEALGEEITPDTSIQELRALGSRAGISTDPGWNHGQIVLELYEHLVERQTKLPTFYMDFPVEVSPLTRAHRKDPRLAERWDLVAFGTELGTGYSELVDPVEERARLTAQSLLAAGGDPEAMQIDEDFLQALEYGMPPTGGMGVGIDRILIMLTGETIRETILFPMVRPE